MPPDGEGRTSRRLRYVGGYELFSPLAAGGMGTVFKAREMSTGRIVALKVLPPSAAKKPDLVERFDHEAEIACRLSHPNIVEGIASGSVNNLHFYAMELIVGESIAEMLARKGRLSSDDTLKIMWDVAQGLFGAHEAGLIHRDVKPHNLMIDTDGVVKLCDLGLARSPEDRELTDATAPIGTPFYMSPEQVACDRPIDARTDIYSLGATAYHMVTGEQPFRADTRAKVMAMHVTDTLVPVRERFPGANEHLAAIIEQCLRKEPEDRYQSMEQLAADLHAIQEGKVPKAFASQGSKQSSRRFISRKPTSSRKAPSESPSARRASSEADTSVEPIAREAEETWDERTLTPSSMRSPRSTSRRITPRRLATQGDGRKKALSWLRAGVIITVVVAAGDFLWTYVMRPQPSRGSGRSSGIVARSSNDLDHLDALDELDDPGRRAEKLAEEGQFDAALAVFDEYPAQFNEVERGEWDARRQAMETRAAETLAGMLADVDRAVEAGDFAQALEILDDASELTYRDSQEQMAQLRARVAEARVIADEEALRRKAEADAAARARMLEARERLAAVIDDFDKAIATVGPHEADKVVSSALENEALADQGPELMTLLSVSEQVARLQEAGTEVLDHLPDTEEPITLKLKTGKTLVGSVTSVRKRGRELMFIMQLTVNGRPKTHVCYASGLEPAARTALLCPGMPRSNDERIARAVVAISWHDTATARAMIDAAQGHLLHGFYEAKLDGLK